MERPVVFTAVGFTPSPRSPCRIRVTTLFVFASALETSDSVACTLTRNVIWSGTGVALPVPVITMVGVSSGSADPVAPVSAAARADVSPPEAPTAYATRSAAATAITITNVRTSIVARVRASSFGPLICPLLVSLSSMGRERHAGGSPGSSVSAG